jgi:hypothetical protein
MQYNQDKDTSTDEVQSKREYQKKKNILSDVCMSVSCECCVLAGRRFCDWPIPRPEISYPVWCVIVCDLET